MKKEYDHSLIVDYVNGKLEGEALTKLETQAATDKALAEEIKFYKELEVVHQVIGEEDLTATIEAATKELESENFFEGVATTLTKEVVTPSTSKKEAVVKTLAPRRNLRRILSFAASFLLLATMGVWWANANFNNEQLAYQSFEETAISNSVRGETNKDVLAEGITALEKKDYEAASQFFEAIPPENEAYSNARYYAALAQFKGKKLEKSKQNAQWVITNDSFLSPKAKWLLVNIYLANNETGNTFQQLLQEIAEDDANPYYQKEAKALQARFNSTWRRLVF